MAQIATDILITDHLVKPTNPHLPPSSTGTEKKKEQILRGKLEGEIPGIVLNEEKQSKIFARSQTTPRKSSA
jgi:hypothetical protein